jgi:pyruvate kinase
LRIEISNIELTIPCANMAIMRRAKVVCTLGPASCDKDSITELVRAGMDVARLNFAHGDHSEHAELIARVRSIAQQSGRAIAILQDLAGPKIRTGRLVGREPVELSTGAPVCLQSGDGEGSAQRLYTSHDLSGEVRVGDPILLADGLLELRVQSVAGQEINCRVIAGGLLGEKKGINLPGSKLSIPALTDKDTADLEFGLEQGVDYVALSFVRSANDLLLLRERIRMWSQRHAGRGLDTPIVAKLEKPQAIDHLDEILGAADVVMVARGDLGVELPPERVPAIQKTIIHAARRQRVPVITATQMLESMTEHPRPTRAEASDVANAVLDGTDALMLSAETASGLYPIESVDMMSRIISQAEAIAHELPRRRTREPLSIPEAIAESVARSADLVELKAIAVFTKGGSTARLVSNYRPRCPIFGLAPDARTRSRMALYWGVTPIESPHIVTTDEMLGKAEQRLLELKLVERGDPIAIVAGSPWGVAGRTNLMKILRAGET